MTYPQNIKLLVLDIDGTIAGKSNQIHDVVKQSIQAARTNGIQVAIATGRMYCSALRFHQEVGSTLPLLAYQGALIKHPANGEIYRHWAVPQAAVHQLLDHFDQPEWRNALSIHFYINDQLFVREITPETEIYAERSGVEPIAVGDLRQASLPEPTKILALSQQTELIGQLLSTLRQRYTPAELYFTQSIATFFEAAHPSVNKGVAVQYLTEEVLGFSAAEVMVIGDNFNDLEMIAYAGIGVAMDNAPDDVKAVADWIAPDVEVHGVACAIEKFLL